MRLCPPLGLLEGGEVVITALEDAVTLILEYWRNNQAASMTVRRVIGLSIDVVDEASAIGRGHFVRDIVIIEFLGNGPWDPTPTRRSGQDWVGTEIGPGHSCSGGKCLR